MEEIWYACYGSNLRSERFNCYIEGGVPEGSTRNSLGSIDKRPSSCMKPFVTQWQLHFARECAGWEDKGVAFLRQEETKPCDPTAQDAIGSGALCRLYKISFEQFIDVFLQENDGSPDDAQLRGSVKSEITAAVQDLKTNETADMREGILDDGWYRRLVRLGTHENLPVVTFTSVEELDFLPPGEAYLQTIAWGLLESEHKHISKDDLAKYLERCAQWNENDVSVLVNKAPSKVVGTKIRKGNQREYTAQLHPCHFEPKSIIPRFLRSMLPHFLRSKSELFQRKALVVLETTHGKQTRQVATRIHPAPVSEEQKGRCLVAPDQIAMDQKLRVAIGVSKLKGDHVKIRHEVAKDLRSPLSDCLERLVGTQPQIMRVERATFEDMEIDIVRILESSLEVIGVSAGAAVSISSAHARSRVRTAVLSECMVKLRKVQKRKDPNYHDARKTLELHRLEGGCVEDIPPIFVDGDLRTLLKVEQGDTVRVVRDCRDLFYSKIYYLLLPILFGLVSAASSFSYESPKETIIRVVCFSFIALLTFAVILLEVRNKFA